MGSTGSTSGKTIKTTLKEFSEINPYNEMNNVDINFEKLLDLVVSRDENEKKKYKDNENLKTEQQVIDIKDDEIKSGKFDPNNQKDIAKLMFIYEKVLSDNEKKYLWRMFLTYSSDNIMSNRQFWSFLDLDFIYNTKFAKLFYKACCDFNDNSKLDYLKFMDYHKFLQFVAIYTKNVKIDGTLTFREMRIKLIYRLFDPDNNDEVDRIEFRNVITSFVEMILTCKFDSEGIQEKIRALNIESSNISMMEKVLDNYVDEVFNSFSYNGELMAFEEWQKWLFSINGIEKVMDFSSALKY